MDVIALGKINELKKNGCVGSIIKVNERFFHEEVTTEPNEEYGGISLSMHNWSGNSLLAKIFNECVAEKIIVVWGREEREYGVSGQNGSYWLGNISFLDPESPDTGEPFAILIDIEQMATMIVTKTPSTAVVQMFLIGKGFKPISTKFLPDVIEGKNGIRLVNFVSKSGKKFQLSVDDNGNLTVVPSV